MKFEKFIQENKKEFEFQEDLSEIWTDIESHQFFIQKKPSSNRLVKIILSIAAVSLLCFIAYSVIDKKSSKQSDVLYATSLEGKPPLAKILAIKTNDFGNEHSEDIMETLLYLIQTETNTNVKLAAIRGVEKYIQNEKVKITLIDLLSKEEEPYITVAVLNILQRGKVKESLPAFNQVIQNKSQVKFVKEEAKRGQELLKNI